MVGLTMLGKNVVITVSPMDSTVDLTQRDIHTNRVSRAVPKWPSTSIATASQIQTNAKARRHLKQASTAVKGNSEQVLGSVIDSALQLLYRSDSPAMTGTLCESTHNSHYASNQVVHDAGSCTIQVGPCRGLHVFIELTANDAHTIALILSTWLRYLVHPWTVICACWKLLNLGFSRGHRLGFNI